MQGAGLGSGPESVEPKGPSQGSKALFESFRRFSESFWGAVIVRLVAFYICIIVLGVVIACLKVGDVQPWFKMGIITSACCLVLGPLAIFFLWLLLTCYTEAQKQSGIKQAIIKETQGSCFRMNVFLLVMALALRTAVQQCRCVKQAWVLDMITTSVAPVLCTMGVDHLFAACFDGRYQQLWWQCK